MRELLQSLQDDIFSRTTLDWLTKTLFHTVSLLVAGLIVLRLIDLALQRVRSET
jgi:hypothetical protein